MGPGVGRALRRTSILQGVSANDDTRAKLLDAARRLYAERGVFSVSLAEVVRAAGQRNTSAIHYHFGNRDRLLLAILEPQAETLRVRRAELLEKARAGDAPEAIVEALVRPLVELAREGWRSRAWMKIGLELADHRERVTPAVVDVLFHGGGGEVLDVLALRLPPMPPHLWELRRDLCIGFVARAATTRAGIIDDHHGRLTNQLDDDTFVTNLVEMFLGAIRAPLPPVL